MITLSALAGAGQKRDGGCLFLEDILGGGLVFECPVDPRIELGRVSAAADLVGLLVIERDAAELEDLEKIFGPALSFGDSWAIEFMH